MNLALGAILLVILLIPPLIFIYFFGKGTHAKGIPKLSLGEYLFLSAVLSLLLHSAVIHFWKLDVDYKFFVQFISGQFKLDDIEKYNTRYAAYFRDFAYYTFWVCLSCGFLGYVSRIIVTNRGIRMAGGLQRMRRNRKPNELFCYFNSWWYYFRANEYDSSYAYLGKREPLVFVDALVNTADGSILYSGVLRDYVIKNDTLYCIYLGNTTKRLFSQKEENKKVILTEGEGVTIAPGGLFCLPYANLINLHIRFVAALTGDHVSIDGNEEAAAEKLRKAVPKDTLAMGGEIQKQTKGPA